jgi:hypothetical protein
VVSGDRISVIDAARASLDTLWSVGDLGGPVAQARFGLNDELFLVPGRAEMTVWHYRIAPRRTLVSRDPVRIDNGESVLLDPQIPVAKLRMADNEDGSVRLEYSAGADEGAIDLAPAEPAGGDRDYGLLPLSRGFLAMVFGARRMRLHLVRRGTHRTVAARNVAEIDWPRAQVQVREQPGRLVLFDNEGRVMEIETDDLLVRALALR